MVPAPVGFQCPECVGAASRQRPQVRTPFGGQVIARPVVTYSLIAIDVAVFILATVVGIDLYAPFAMWPPAISLGGEWYRLVTAVFLHWGWLHLAFNMYVLYALGPTLERLLGHLRFIVLFLLAGLGGSVLSYALSDVDTASAGASGAIFGLMGALVVAGRRLRYDITQVLVLIGINIVIGFLPGLNVDWRAHLGGLLTGAAVAAVMVHAPRRGRAAWQALGIVALVVLLVVVVGWRTGQIQDAFAPALLPT